MSQTMYSNGKPLEKVIFHREDEFEREIANNATIIFGKDVVYINAKKRISTRTFGDTIPDGLLFDFTDPETPDFYLVEIELASHSFFGHIFPQITKFITARKNPATLRTLKDEIYNLTISNLELKQRFQKYSGETELYVFLQSILENSFNILLVLDSEKIELEEIQKAYTDTWDKIVKPTIIEFHKNGDDQIITTKPDLREKYFEVEKTDNELVEQVYTEEYHLDGIDPVLKNAYVTIKTALLGKIPDLHFNPQHYYISVRQTRNVAYFEFRRKKIHLVILLPEATVREFIAEHLVTALSKPVQDFYGVQCCRVTLENDRYLDEVIKIIDMAIIARVNR